MKKIYFLFFLLLSGTISKSQTAQAPPANPNYFPIAVWLQSTFNANNYKNIGINMYVGIYSGLDQAQLTDLKNAGLKVMCDQNSFSLTKLSDTTIYGWTQEDEPDNAQWNSTTSSYDPCIATSVIINKYNTIKANDATRPVYLNLGQGVSYINWVGRGTCTGNTDMYKISKNGYLKGCDIGSFDIYPVNSTDAQTKEKLWYVPKGIDSLYLWSNNTKPIWTWIETTKIDANSNRKPTPLEVKAEVWMALIHGAKGFGYFCHSWTPSFDEYALLHDATMKAAVSGINSQITSLAAVLNSATTAGYATVSSSNGGVPIDIMTKNYGGSNYIFSVGMRPGKTKATYTVSSGASVTVLGEGRTIPVTGGQFTDSINADFQVHLYKISPAATSVNEINEFSRVRVFPNPVMESSRLEIFSNSEAEIQIEVIDVLGKILASKSENVIPGMNSFNFDNSDLKPGMYFIRMCGAQSKTITRFVKNE